MVSDNPILRGLSGGFDRLVPPPLIARVGKDFVTGLLADLAAPKGLDLVAAGQPAIPVVDGKLRLYQPAHRVFHLVVLELDCDVPGLPRLDPRKLDSAGLVVRRMVSTTEGIDAPGQAWVDEMPTIRASPDGLVRRRWGQLGRDNELRDPDVSRRPVIDGGNASVGVQRRARASYVREVTAPLFLAPPAVCQALGKTVLYGVVPTASSDVSAPSAANLSDEQIASLVPPYLRQGIGTPPLLGDIAGSTLTQKRAQASSGASLAKFLQFLRQLVVQFDAFSDTSDGVLLQLLNEIELVFPFTSRPAGVSPLPGLGGLGDFGLLLPNVLPAGDWLRWASWVLLTQGGNDPPRDPSGVYDPQHPDPDPKVVMPLAWPAISADLAQRLSTEIATVVATRMPAVQARPGRFSDPGAVYHVRAFARVRRDDGCPPVLVWSQPTQMFSIAAWYESSPLPPLEIVLPDIDRQFLRKLKPNVSFRVPSKLFNLLRDNKALDLLAGKGKPGVDVPGAALGWVCSFNIPIITICAYILLMVIVAILNIIFWWLPFIQICFPIGSPPFKMPSLPLPGQEDMP